MSNMYIIHARWRTMRVVITGMSAALTLMLLGAVVPRTALAAPKGIFSVFAQCPTSAMAPQDICDHAEITSGEIAIGPVQIQIDKTIVLQGGTFPTGAGLNEYYLLPALDGEDISLTRLEVPGGLRTLFGCPKEGDRGRFGMIPYGICEGWYGWPSQVTATIEHAASPAHPAILNLANLGFEEGTALTFPIKLHLQGPLLGEACYLGSEASPIALTLTDGATNPPAPNQPISGKRGKLFEEEEDNHSVLVAPEVTLVDNAFAVPTVEGCGGSHLSWLVDPLIDHALGLESPAGHNTIILTGTHKTAEAQEVIASESFPVKEEPAKEESPTPPHRHGWPHWWPQR